MERANYDKIWYQNELIAWRVRQGAPTVMMEPCHEEETKERGKEDVNNPKGGRHCGNSGASLVALDLRPEMHITYACKLAGGMPSSTRLE